MKAYNLTIRAVVTATVTVASDGSAMGAKAMLRKRLDEEPLFQVLRDCDLEDLEVTSVTKVE
jgi:hypothetical protein